ncbi:MAG: DUF5305 family protein [Haloferacaceae archaeon]
MTTLPPRLRYLLAKRGLRVAATLLLVGAVLLAGAGYVYATPPTTQVTDRTNQQTVTSELSTAATVTGNTSLYERGTTLRDQPVYLQRAAPVGTVVLTTTLPGSGSANHTVELVYTATRGGETFWKRTRLLDVETTREDGTVRTTASLRIDDLQRQLAIYAADIGQSGAASVSIRVTVEYASGPYEGTFSGTYPVGVGDGWYTLGTDEFSRTHSEPVEHTVALPVENRPSFLVPTGGGLVLVLVGVATGLAARRLDGDADRDLLAAVHRNRYGEWISEGSLPAGAPETLVEVDTLEALVDVAIDSGKRVIHDPERDCYAVLDGRVQYRFSRGGSRPADDLDWQWADAEE